MHWETKTFISPAFCDIHLIAVVCDQTQISPSIPKSRYACAEKQSETHAWSLLSRGRCYGPWEERLLGQKGSIERRRKSRIYNMTVFLGGYRSLKMFNKYHFLQGKNPDIEWIPEVLHGTE